MVTLITGAANGIGRAVAIKYCQLGHKVILLDYDLKGLENTYDYILQQKHTQPTIYPLNLANAAEKDYSDLAKNIHDEFGKLDCLIHNAALIGGLTPIAQYKVELWYKILQVNLNSCFLLTQNCLPLLKKSNNAKIIFTIDTVGTKGTAFWGAYGVAKAGLINFAEILADELEIYPNIKVHTIDPGAVKTTMRAQIFPGESQAELLAPEDVVSQFINL